MRTIAQCGSYRIVDDLPMWGGYYSIEEKKMYGDCEVWSKVYGCTSNLDDVRAEFARLISRNN